MPKLSNISCHFDDIKISDGYTGVSLFKAQLSTFNEAAKEGSTNKKRTMSVRPGTVIPPRRLIGYFDESWIVGDRNTDGLQGVALRQTYWITKMIDMAIRLTPAQVALNIQGFTFATSKVYLKDTVNFVSDSEYDPQWDFTISASESVAKGEFLSAAGKLFRVRSSHTTEAGFITANCDELDGSPRVAVTIRVAGEFNPITETRGGAVVNTFGILFDPSKLFRFMSQADPRNLSGDMTLVLAQNVPVGSLVTVLGVNWKVLTCSPELDGWSLHIRRA